MGEFLQRPSQLTVKVRPPGGAEADVLVNDQAYLVATGTLTPTLSALFYAG